MGTGGTGSVRRHRWPRRFDVPAPVERRTLLLALGLLGLAAALAPSALGSRPTDHGPDLAWWELAAGFTLAAVFVFHVEIDDEATTFSLSEVPLVLGLLFCRPGDLILARLVGEAVVLVALTRQTWPKLTFNLSVFVVECSVALAGFRVLVGRPDPLAARTWLACWAAVVLAGLLGTLAVWLVIRLHSGHGSPGSLLLTAAVTSTGNAALAAVAGILIHVDPAALAPLLVLAVIVIAAYRGYHRLAGRYAGLELLYQFTRITSGTQSPDQTLRRVLDEACRLLRARRAVIALYHPGDDVPWLSLTGGAGSTTTDTAAIGTTTTDAGTADGDRVGGGAGSGGSGDGVGGATDPAPAAAAPVDVPGAGTGAPTAPVVLPEPIRREVLRAGQLLVVPRHSDRPGHAEVLAALGATDCLAAPLASGGVVSGVLLVCDRLGAVSTFDAEDARLFATLASQAAVALENGRLIERLHEQVAAREHESLHDALTGLPNRTLFAQRLRSALTEDADGRGAVLLMDLDGFKEVNDTLGHHLGDQLLTEVASRLLRTVGRTGTVARLGGDEFALLLPRLGGAQDGLAVAATVTEVLREPVRLASLALEVRASIGVAVWPEHGTDPSGLLQRADVAMYAAKRDRTGVTLYDPRTDWNSELRLRLAGELRHAIENRQIEVWYQPIARAVDQHVVGAEALVRWNHPELGRIGPDEFIPIAERTGLIHDLTRYVLDHALAQTRAWRAAGLELDVAVNLSTQVLRDVDWPAKVAELLHLHQADPHWLTFEITETGLMADPQAMTTMLHELASTGITFAIDDFGTGYSSLAYLQQLPVSKVKIDKSFVIPMTSDPGATAIVRSVIDLARSLELAVVAEGVEDQQALDRLIEMDCHLVQGYFLSRPVPAVEFTGWIRGREAARRQRPALRVLKG